MKTPEQILSECPKEMEELIRFATTNAVVFSERQSLTEEAFRWRRIVYALSQIVQPGSISDMS